MVWPRRSWVCTGSKLSFLPRPLSPLLPCFRATVKREQRVAHGLGDEAADRLFFAKLHLALLRMNVHVNGGGIEFKEQAADGETAAHQRCVVAFEQGKVEAAILDRTQVDEEMLLVPRAA